jgi:hypothetical protein
MTLELHLVKSDSSSAKSGYTIIAQITRLSQPSISSIVMKLDLRDETQPAVLKLFDNLFAPDSREEWEARFWSDELEAEYHTFLRSEEGEVLRVGADGEVMSPRRRKRRQEIGPHVRTRSSFTADAVNISKQRLQLMNSSLVCKAIAFPNYQRLSSRKRN